MKVRLYLDKIEGRWRNVLELHDYRGHKLYYMHTLTTIPTDSLHRWILISARHTACFLLNQSLGFACESETKIKFKEDARFYWSLASM